jgi:hypothetical protein
MTALLPIAAQSTASRQPQLGFTGKEPSEERRHGRLRAERCSTAAPAARDSGLLDQPSIAVEVHTPRRLAGGTAGTHVPPAPQLLDTNACDLGDELLYR